MPGRATAALLAALLGAAAALFAGCGGGGDGPTTVAGWQEEHGPRVDEVNLAIERVQGSTKKGEPTAIRANCEALRDAVTEAEEAPPVPDPGVEGKLRAALNGVEAGAGDCVRAMTSGDARLLERSIVELREAQLELDTARASLAR